MPESNIFNPPSLGTPLGQYSQIARVTATEFVFIAGQVAGDRAGNIVGRDDFDAQCVQTFANVQAALESVGAGWGNIVQFTTYLVDSGDIQKLRDFRTREFPRLFPDCKYPPNTLLIVSALAHKDYLLEVQVVAAI